MLKYITVFFICLLFFKTSKGQGAFQDTSSHQSATLNNYIQNYTVAIGEQSSLYNGPEYENYNPAIKGNAYYNDVNSWKLGTVCYDHVVYKNVPMMYDIYKDCVVVLYANKFSLFFLLNDKLQYFDLADRHFVSVKSDNLNSSNSNNGIYNQIYKGKTEILTKSSKSIQITTTGNLESYFDKREKKVYLKNGNEYYNINGNSSILKAFNDKKSQVQQYIKANNINYKRDQEKALIQVAFYYDQIKN